MSNTKPKRYGRPLAINKSRVQKLESAFRAGLNVKEACLYAQIARQTYYTKLREDNSFLDKIEASKLFIAMTAKKLIAKAILEGSVSDAWKYLEKRDEDFKDKGSTLIDNSNTQISEGATPEQMKRIADKMILGKKARAAYWKKKYEELKNEQE